MIVYLLEEEIREINRFSLELTGEGDNFQVVQPDDVRFVIRFVSEQFGKDTIFIFPKHLNKSTE